MINALLAASTGATSSADKISIPPIRYLPILPPIIMIGGAVVLLAVASLVKRDLRVRVSTIGSVIIAGGALGISIWQWSDVQSHGAHTYIAHAVVMDGFSVLVTMLLVGRHAAHAHWWPTATSGAKASPGRSSMCSHCSRRRAPC